MKDFEPARDTRGRDAEAPRPGQGPELGRSRRDTTAGLGRTARSEDSDPTQTQGEPPVPSRKVTDPGMPPETSGPPRTW